MRTVWSETLRTAATAIGIEELCPKVVRQHGSAPIGPCASGTRRYPGSVGDGRTPPAGVRSVRGGGPVLRRNASRRDRSGFASALRRALAER
ncbi:MAG: hypothetical protein AVDCRST_MAG19-4558 [uncultured Thermomicrobiales bacterium]|uniref:Uncharacterized protein n=1 Tax=uncultured Thermomicrobiales bacterium TaxID=1645740 RepID=A0A6J4VSA4_9BACT|nr:MAG: hypothetical protein AVDCRST_MAG19-4558 [uncultured Thermomicrobiales bacterium]